MSAPTREPGRRPRALAKASDTSAGNSAVAARARLQRPAGAQHHAVHARRLARVQADQLAEDRVVGAGHVDAHDLLDRDLHVGHAGHLAQHRHQRLRRALDAGEQLGEAAFGVRSGRARRPASPPPRAW